MSLTRESAYATHAIAAATRANGSHRVSIKELIASTPKDRSATPSTAVDDGATEPAGFVAPLVARESTSRVSPGGVAYLTKLLIKITMSAGCFDAALHPRAGKAPISRYFEADGGKCANIFFTPLSRFLVLLSALSESVSLEEPLQINFSVFPSNKSTTKVPTL